MSYTPKQGNSSGAGGGNVNPNQINQQAKATLAGIANMQQQMQNLVSQSPQNPSLNAFFNLQQQNLLKQQMLLQNTQFLQQLQQQQQQQQTQPPIQQNLPGKEPLALTRTPNAAELLNKTFQQQANGSAVGAPNLGNVAQFSQHLQAFPNTANLMQHLQAYQYQMQQQQQQNQPQHQSHQQQNKMQQQAYTGQQNTGHHNQQQYQQNYQQQQKFGAGTSSQQTLSSTQQQHSHQHQQQPSLNKNSQNMGNQISKPPNLPAATQITPILPPSVSVSQQQPSNNNTQNKNQAKPQVTMTPTTVGKTGPQLSSNKPAGGSSSFMANRSISSPYGKTSHGHYQNSSTLNYKTGSSKLPPPTQITAVPLTKPTIATSSPIKTSMPAGSNVSSPRSGHTPPAVNPPKPVTPPVSITPSNVTQLPPKNVNITSSKPSAGHPIPTSIPAPIPAAVVAASVTSTLSVPPLIQQPVHPVTQDILISAPSNTQKEASPPKLADMTITSKTENKTPSTNEKTLNKVELHQATNKDIETTDKKQEQAGVEEKQLSSCENKGKKEELATEIKISEVENQVSKDEVTDKLENKKTVEDKSLPDNKKAEIHEKDKIEKLHNEEKIEKADNKNEINQFETNEMVQNSSLNSGDKTNSLSENVQLNNNKETILSEEKAGKVDLVFEVAIPSQKVTDNTVNSLIEKSDEKVIEKQIDNKSDVKKDEPLLENPVTKDVKTETHSNTNPVSISDEKNNDKNIISPTELALKKQEESLEEEPKSTICAKSEITEDKSTKFEKAVITTRNTQQKNKNLDSSAKIDKQKPETKKKIISANSSGTVKEESSRPKSEKLSTFIDNSDSITKNNEDLNSVDTKDKENSSEISTSGNVNNQSTPAMKTLHDDLSIKSSNTEMPKDESGSSRSKRHRLKTILYQSPLPELAFITKLSASEASNSPKPGSGNEDKLVLFYKNEYLAVRNAEGGFFLCQTLHNVYKTSPRIRIRWLSEEKSETGIYIPDFYDNTDIECVLTTVDLSKVSRDRFNLPEHEKDRIENILKKAIDVEKGLLPRPDITEENPDGLDISLYTDESQIEKRKRNSKSPRSSQKLVSSNKNKLKSKSPSKTKSNVKRKRNDDSDNSEDDYDEEPENDKEYKPSHKKRIVTQSQQDQTVRRLQRSPLAKARAASPITLKKQISKSVPQKSSDATPSSSRQSRAAKRRGTDSGIEDGTPYKKPNVALTPSKKPSDKINKISKTDEGDEQTLPENGQNVKSGISKRTKHTNPSSSPVSEKAPNNSTLSTTTPTGAVRTTRSRK